MDAYLSVDAEVKLIDTIISSISDLIPLLNDSLHQFFKIKNSITEVIIFMRKLIKSLPEIVFSGFKFSITKNDLLISYAIFIEEWDRGEFNKPSIQLCWDNFLFHWSRFKNEIERIDKSTHTVYLSMN